MKYLNLIILLLIFACNPIPKEDAHPDVPMLSELLKDNSKFKLITNMDGISELIFLNDDRILIKPNSSNLSFKIIDTNKNIIFQDIYDWKVPFYIDEQGNFYFNKKKFFYPDYKKREEFKTVVFADSLSKKSEELKDLKDSLRLIALDKYEIEILKPYDLKPCQYTILYTDRCNVFMIKNNVLIVRQIELFKTEFSKQTSPISKFDDDVLVRWENGRLPEPVYLSYYELNMHKFKCSDLTMPSTITLKGKNYFYARGFGLYEILF